MTLTGQTNFTFTGDDSPSHTKGSIDGSLYLIDNESLKKAGSAGSEIIVDGAGYTKKSPCSGSEVLASTLTSPPGTPKSPDSKNYHKLSCCQIALAVFAVLSIITGIVMLAGAYQAMFDAILKSQLQVSEGSTAYSMWSVTPVPIFLKIYFFNLTNPWDFQQGAKPFVTQVGPYCFREFHQKENLTFHANATVTFFQRRWWIWDQELSEGNQRDDVIVAVNSVPISASYSVRTNLFLLERLNDQMLMINESLIVNVTVMQMLFDGFQDPLLDLVQEAVVWENGTFHNLDTLTALIPQGLLDYDKFGWFYMRNMSLTYDGKFNMFTGEDTLENVGKIDLWNQRNETLFFDSPCNELRGSAGELWPPGLNKDFIEFYSSDLCMSMKLFFKNETEDSNGLNGYRYWGTNLTFANGTDVPENECYCVKETCAPRGLLNSESCRMGAPAFISFPHFYNADPFLLNDVIGLDPVEEKHAFTMDLIPELGTPFGVAARMQINMHVQPYPGKGNPLNRGQIFILKDVPDVYLPMMWFEELAAIPSDLAWQLNSLLFIMNTPTVTIIWGCCIIIGVIILACLAYTVITRGRKGEGINETGSSRF